MTPQQMASHQALMATFMTPEQQAMVAKAQTDAMAAAGVAGAAIPNPVSTQNFYSGSGAPKAAIAEG